MNSNFEGFVLAGGKSSRMKTDKAFLKFGGKTFLERATNTLRPICGKIKIVINENQKAKFENAFPSLYFIFDIYQERGALAGIHAALINCASECAIILAVDLPFVTGRAIEILAQKAIESKAISAVVPQQLDGKLQPLCAVYRVPDCLPIVEKLLSENTSVSMKNFLQNIPIQIVEPELLTNEMDLFSNINYPSDFQALK